MGLHSNFNNKRNDDGDIVVGGDDDDDNNKQYNKGYNSIHCLHRFRINCTWAQISDTFIIVIQLWTWLSLNTRLYSPNGSNIDLGTSKTVRNEHLRIYVYFIRKCE